VAERDPVAEALLLDVLRQQSALPQEPDRPARALLIGIQAAGTVEAANAILGADHVVLLHLDRATKSVGLGLGNHELLLGEDPAMLGPFGLVAVNVEAAKSYRLLREIVRQTAAQVSADGVVLVAGPKKGGAEVAAKILRERFEAVDLLAYRKGERVYRAARPHALGETVPSSPFAGTPTEPGADRQVPELPATELVELRGLTLRLYQDERIFARGRLDPATRMLAEAFEIRPGASVLDLGSGSGVLGMLAALLEPSSRVVLVDSDPLAIDVSRRNAALNGVTNVTAYLSDVLADLPGQCFDLILMNPPFHRGRAHDAALAERFMTEAAGALLPGGRLYVVCSRFLRYEPTLERLVGPVREVTGDRQFKVLLTVRGARSSPSPQASRHTDRAGPNRSSASRIDRTRRAR
jgi:16S rRNA (guanine1207-N2)-methyltransferase